MIIEFFRYVISEFGVLKHYFSSGIWFDLFILIIFLGIFLILKKIFKKMFPFETKYTHDFFVVFRFLVVIFLLFIFFSRIIILSNKVPVLMSFLIGSFFLGGGLYLAFNLVSLLKSLHFVITSPFQIGDDIEIDGDVGKIRKIGLFSVVVINENGDSVYYPFHMFLNKKVKYLKPQNYELVDLHFETEHLEMSDGMIPHLYQKILALPFNLSRSDLHINLDHDSLIINYKIRPKSLALLSEKAITKEILDLVSKKG